MWTVKIKRKLERKLAKMPRDVQDLFALLKADLEYDGPVQSTWSNYSKLGEDKYHCHLNYRYVACWTVTNNELIMEVYYVGSRENAPY